MVASYAKPLWCWCSPVFSLPPARLVSKAFRAIVRSQCAWWCRGRFWAMHIELHPVYSAILTRVHRLTYWDIMWSKFLERNVQSYMKALNLEFVKFDANVGILFRRKSDESNENVIRAFGKRKTIWSNEGRAMHILRIVARARALEATSTTRLDSEGVAQVDLEASSTKPWKSFIDSLCKADRGILEIYRAGAATTLTRRNYRRDNSLCASCPSCGAATPPSLRHLVCECATYHPQRLAIRDQWRLPSNWWTTLPRVTSKTGWITFEAHPWQQRRGEMQVAVCQLAMKIMMDPIHMPDAMAAHARKLSSS